MQRARIYRIKGTLWKQGLLLYPEVEATKGIVKEAFQVIKADDATIWNVIDEIITQKVAPKIIATVLKPYEPTILHRWWNRRKFRNGRPDNIIEWMDLQQVGRVLFDFFMINFGWIGNALPMQMNFDSIFQAMKQASGSIQTRSSMPSPEETSTNETES